MERATITVLFAAATLACNALSGVADLTADPTFEGAELPPRDVGADPDGATGDAGGGAPGDGVDPDADANAPASTRIRDITFEDGALVHVASGFDTVAGTATITTVTPIAGTYAMDVTGTAAGGTVAFAAAADLYVTLRIRVKPSSAIGAAVIARVTHSGGEPLELRVGDAPARAVSVTQGAATIATGGALPSDDTVHRIELRLRSASRGLTVRVVKEASGSSATISTNANFGASTQLEVGALSGGDLDAVIDDVQLDRAVQP